MGANCSAKCDKELLGNCESCENSDESSSEDEDATAEAVVSAHGPGPFAVPRAVVMRQKAPRFVQAHPILQDDDVDTRCEEVPELPEEGKEVPKLLAEGSDITESPRQDPEATPEIGHRERSAEAPRRPARKQMGRKTRTALELQAKLQAFMSNRTEKRRQVLTRAVQEMAAEGELLKTLTELMEATDTFEAQDSRPLGLSFESTPPDPVMVEAVTAGSWAEEAGMTIGVEIVELNGQPVAHMSKVDFWSMIGEVRPLEMKIEGRFNYILNSLYDEVPDVISDALKSELKSSPKAESREMRKERRLSTGRLALVRAMQDPMSAASSHTNRVSKHDDMEEDGKGAAKKGRYGGA